MTSHVTPTWRTITELIEQSYRSFPHNIAFADERATLTFAELEERARRLATWLKHRGLEPGDRVVIITSNRVEYPQVEHALSIGNFIRVALADRLHPEEVAKILDDCRPDCIFVEDTWLAQASDRFYEHVTCPLVVIGADGDHEGQPSRPAISFDDVTSSTLAPDDFPQAQPDDAAWVMYTSGTTGTPKGVVHTHASVTAMLRNVVWTFGSVTEDDTAVHTAPLSHLSGAMGWAVTSVGGRNQLLGHFSPETLLDTVDAVQATVMPVVPTQLNMITDYLSTTSRATDTIRLIPYAGSAITPDRLETAQAFFGGGLVQMFGASEVPMPITVLFPEDHKASTNHLGLPRFASAGRPAPGVEIVIQDDLGKPVEIGAPGEIVVRSATACRGYWNNPDATAEILDSDGFVHTGDIGLMDEDGYLFIVDRKKDMIVSGGFNIYPREVENAIADMPNVREVAVVSAPDPQWGETVVAVIASRDGNDLELLDIQSHCRTQLAGYKIPRRLVMVSELPKGGTGKVKKNSLTEQFWGTGGRKVGG